MALLYIKIILFSRIISEFLLKMRLKNKNYPACYFSRDFYLNIVEILLKYYLFVL